MRIYTAKPGKEEALTERFLTKTLPIFRRIGIEVTGVFAPSGGSGTLWYMLRYPDEETRTRLWEAFGSDPEWREVKQSTESDGPLLDSQKAVQLKCLLESGRDL